MLLLPSTVSQGSADRSIKVIELDILDIVSPPAAEHAVLGAERVSVVPARRQVRVPDHHAVLGDIQMFNTFTNYCISTSRPIWLNRLQMKILNYCLRVSYDLLTRS